MSNVNLLYIDLFCGAGGTSTGVTKARLFGKQCAKVVACVNHDANAIASHQAKSSEGTEEIPGCLRGIVGQSGMYELLQGKGRSAEGR